MITGVLHPSRTAGCVVWSRDPAGAGATRVGGSKPPQAAGCQGWCGAGLQERADGLRMPRNHGHMPLAAARRSSTVLRQGVYLAEDEGTFVYGQDGGLVPLSRRFARPAGGAFSLGAVWRAFGQSDDVFQYGRTTSRDPQEIAKAVSVPGREVSARSGTGWILFAGPNGHVYVFETESYNPHINSGGAGSHWMKSGGGSQLYQAAFDWAHNNGKTIVPHPGGITSINSIRRTSNMLASAVRWGTTRHMVPHEDQNV